MAAPFWELAAKSANPRDAQNALYLQPGIHIQAYDATLASLAGLSVVQGNLLYGSAVDTLALLAKDANATRYLSNQGTSNNPSWNQVNLANGVTGDLPFANLTQGAALTVLANATNGTADFAALAAASDHQVLRRSGTALAFGAVNLAQSAAITGTLPVANGGTGDTGTAWTAYTPTVTATTGTFTTVSAVGNYKQIGKTVFFAAEITITTIGTAAGRMKVSLPVNTSNLYVGHGSGGNNAALRMLAVSPGLINATDAIVVFASDDTFPGTSGQILYISGTYEAA